MDAFAAISVYTFVIKLYHLCMTGNISEFILFIASPRDDKSYFDRG